MTTTLEKPDTAEAAPPTAPARAKRGKAAKTEPPPTPGALACSVSQASLKLALSRVTRAVSVKPFMPILTGVRLTTIGEDLHLACTDLSIAVTTQIVVTDGVDGTYAVPARLLADFVATLPNDTVTLRRAGEILHVACGRAKAQIKGMESEDFPALPNEKIKNAADVRLDAEALNKALALTVFASAIEESRPVLAGIHLEADGLGSFVAEATDGYRLAVHRSHLESEAKPFDIIVPRRGAQEIGRLAEDGALDVWLLPTPESPSHLVLRSENTTLSLRLSEGQFPDLNRTIPKSAPITVTVPRAELLGAVNQALLFATSEAAKDGKASFQLLRLTPGDGVLILAASGAERGEGESVVTAEIAIDDGATPERISVNGPYLREQLAALEGESVVLALSGALSPILVTDPTLPDYRAVIMPMHTIGK